MTYIIAACTFGLVGIMCLVKSYFADRRGEPILSQVLNVQFWLCIGIGILIFILAPIVTIYA